MLFLGAGKRATKKIVNRQRKPQTNNMMDTVGVYKFDLGLSGLQNYFIG